MHFQDLEKLTAQAARAERAEALLRELTQELGECVYCGQYNDHPHYDSCPIARARALLAEAAS